MGIGPIWGITSLTFILSCFSVINANIETAAVLCLANRKLVSRSTSDFMRRLHTKVVPFSGWRYIKGKRFQKLKYRRGRESCHLGIPKGLSKRLEQRNCKNMQCAFSSYVKGEPSQYSLTVLRRPLQVKLYYSID